MKNKANHARICRMSLKCTGTAAAATASSCFEVRCSQAFQRVLECLKLDNRFILFDSTLSVAYFTREKMTNRANLRTSSSCMVGEGKLMCAIDAKVVCSLKSNTSAITFEDLWG